MTQIKVGDKVKIKSLEHSDRNLEGYMDYLVGTVQEVIDIRGSSLIVPNKSSNGPLDRWHISTIDVKLVTEETPKRKKKILYPVGTKVRVVKSVSIDGELQHRSTGLVGTVVGYSKGDNYPYKLDTGGTTQFNVQELERFSEDCEKDCKPDEPTKQCEPTFTLAEVKEIAREEARRAVSAYDAERAFESEMTALIEGFNKLTATEVAEKEKTTMNKPELTLRQKVKYFALSKDEKVLRESGFHDSGGSLTEQGRRIVVDVLWEGMTAAERKKVVEAVAATLPKEK